MSIIDYGYDEPVVFEDDPRIPEPTDEDIAAYERGVEEQYLAFLNSPQARAHEAAAQICFVSGKSPQDALDAVWKSHPWALRAPNPFDLGEVERLLREGKQECPVCEEPALKGGCWDPELAICRRCALTVV